ncbi:MAG: hypothetical protein J6Y90_00640, partial [Lachnospiraceae bacterium]|nr:hypothetical protein [Lachnospiraceae bacterium]
MAGLLGLILLCPCKVPVQAAIESRVAISSQADTDPLNVADSAIDKEKPVAKEPLTVGVPTDRCPIFYLDEKSGQMIGIGVDLMRTAAENAGYV